MITIGIYALSGFEVTPATVTGVLTILGLLALRHRRRLRQGAGEHQEPPGEPPDLRRGRQPRGQPDPGAVDQHLDRGADPGRRDPLRRRRAARQRAAEGPRAGAVRRHGRRRLLLDLHRDAAAGAHEVARARRPGAGEADQGAPSPRRRPLRRRCPAFTEDMPIAADPNAAPAGAARRQPAAPPAPAATARSPTTDAVGRGRVVPPSRGPVQPSSSSRTGHSRRRKTKSKRGKK